MQKQVSYKIVSLVFGILVLSFVVGFYIFAWTEPQLTPPQGNVDRPINVGGTGQIKSGALTIGGGFESRGVTLLATFGGNVGIGTTSPQAKLDVAGNIKFNGQKVCGPFDAQNFNSPILVPSSWTAITCKNFRDSIGGTDYQIGCIFENSFSWGGPIGSGPVKIPSPNCGW